MNDIKTDRRWTRCAPRIRPLWSSWNSRRKSFYNFGNIIMIGEFPSGISTATDSTLAYIFIRINITSTRMRFRLDCLRKRSYLNPLNTPFLHSLVRSFTRSFLLYTGSIFLSKKGKCPQRCSDVPNAELLITSRPIHLMMKRSEWTKEAYPTFI